MNNKKNEIPPLIPFHNFMLSKGYYRTKKDKLVWLKGENEIVSDDEYQSLCGEFKIKVAYER